MYSCCCCPTYWGPFLPMGVLVDGPLDDDNKKNKGEECRCIGWNKKNDTPKSHECRNLTYKFLKFCAWRNFNLKLQNSTMEIMPENLESKFVFEVFRESGISKFLKIMDFVSKLRFDRTQVRPRSHPGRYSLWV